jgi:hypothetical protein
MFAGTLTRAVRTRKRKPAAQSVAGELDESIS